MIIEFQTFNLPSRLTYSIFTKPITDFKVIIITRNDAPFMDGISALSGKKVAVIKGLGVYNEIVKPHPGIERIEKSRMEELFKAVSESEAYATFSSPLFAGYLMQNYPNLKIAGVTDHPPESYMNMRFARIILNSSVLSIKLSSLSPEKNMTRSFRNGAESSLNIVRTGPNLQNGLVQL